MLIEVYGDTAPTDKLCREWFGGWKFQRWRQVSLWTAKKIRRQRIRGITRRRSELNARRACRIIKGNSTSLLRLRAMGMIQKQGNWVPYELNPRNVERRFFTCEQLIQRQRKDFLHRIVTGDEKWIFYDKTSRRKNTTLSPVNRCHRPQHQHHSRTFMVRRSCSVSDRIKRVLFTMSCWNLAIPLWAIGIGYLIRLSRALREKWPEYEQRHDKVFFFMTTLGLMLKS